MTLKRSSARLGMGVLLLAAGAASSATAAAADPPAKPIPKTAAAPALPAPGTYEIDPAHSFAYFGALHHVVGLVRGRFDNITGTITVSQDLAACGVDVKIDPSSISTQVRERDEDLRGPAYFDVKVFPTMTYHGRGIRQLSGTSWTMDGALTIHGVTNAVPLTFTYNGAFADLKPGKPARVAFHASAGAKRADFGMGARDKGEVGASPAPDVEIEIDVEADARVPAQSNEGQIKLTRESRNAVWPRTDSRRSGGVADDLQLHARIGPLEDRVHPLHHLIFQGVLTATLALKDREGLHDDDGRLAELERKVRDHGNQSRAADVASQGFLLVFRSCSQWLE